MYYTPETGYNILFPDECFHGDDEEDYEPAGEDRERQRQLGERFVSEKSEPDGIAEVFERHCGCHDFKV